MQTVDNEKKSVYLVKSLFPFMLGGSKGGGLGVTAPSGRGNPIVDWWRPADARKPCDSQIEVTRGSSTPQHLARSRMGLSFTRPTFLFSSIHISSRKPATTFN